LEISKVGMLAMLPAQSYCIDSQHFFESATGATASCHFGVIFERVNNLKKLDLAQIFLGSSRSRAVSCVGGRLVI
jgi:hypothetical protein